MHRKISWMAAIAFAVGAVAAWAQVNTGRPMLELTFETDDGGWMGFGSNVQTRVTHEPAHVKSGKGALAVSYDIAPRQLGLAVLPIQNASLARMKSLRFWLQTDSSTSVAVLLSEAKPGGDYTAVVWSPKDTWQQVELIPEDFALNQGPNDPKDPDGRLDLDQVRGVGIMDLSQIFTGVTQVSKFPIMVDRHSGPHTLWVDDFQVRADVPAVAAPAGAVVIDDFRRNSIRWLTLGGVDLSISAGKPFSRSLQASYEQAENRFVVIVHPMGSIDLSGVERLEFDIASEHDAQIVISLEKKKPGGQGARYNAMAFIPGGRELGHEAIPLSEFSLDQNGPADPGGKLDPSSIRLLTITDITAALSQERQKNTLWIANIQAARLQP